MKYLVIAILYVGSIPAQTEKPTGAKALFFAAESGDQTLTSTSAQSGRTPSAAELSHNTAVHPKAVITGLKYYIDLREPDGALLRVNPSHVFHSGDHIRFQVSTNVDGDLVIYQKQDDQPEERLYPASSLKESTGHVTPNSEVTLPSIHGWFVFDENPGQISLTLLVKARGSRLGRDVQADAGKGLSPDAAHALVAVTKGSKALIMEDDSTGDKAQYKVMDSSLDSKIPAGMVATEVTLSHAK